MKATARRTTWLLGVVVVVILGLGAAAVLQLKDLRNLQGAEDQRAAVMQAASRQVILLTTVDANTSAKDVNRLLAGATTSFRAQFEKDASSFFATLKAAHVVSQGSVDAIGITKFGDQRAEVIVAATGTVTNATTTSPEKRAYRLQVQLQRVSGKWLVSEMRFVV